MFMNANNMSVLTGLQVFSQMATSERIVTVCANAL